jgi:hypothetical protein
MVLTNFLKIGDVSLYLLTNGCVEIVKRKGIFFMPNLLLPKHPIIFVTVPIGY